MSTRHLIIVGGPNGAGKTTFAMADVARHGGVYLGADAIAAELRPDNPAAVAIEAGRAFLERLDRLLQSESRLVVESTLAGKSLAGKITAAKSLGFHIKVVFVYVESDDTSLIRVHQRVLNGGHDVPEADVRRRFGRAVANFWTRFRLLADDWLLIYNGGSEPLEVASGSGDQLSVFREERFVQFQQFVKRQLP